LAYIGSGSIEVGDMVSSAGDTRSIIQFKGDLILSGAMARSFDNQNFFPYGKQKGITLSASDNTATPVTTTKLGVDTPWLAYMELDCHRIGPSTNVGAGAPSYISVGPGDYAGQIVTLMINRAATGSANKMVLVLTGSPGNEAAGYKGLFGAGQSIQIQGVGNGGAIGHFGACWQMVWTGTYWQIFNKNKNCEAVTLP